MNLIFFSIVSQEMHKNPVDRQNEPIIPRSRMCYFYPQIKFCVVRIRLNPNVLEKIVRKSNLVNASYWFS